jgi:hypothetical protein
MRYVSIFSASPQLCGLLFFFHSEAQGLFLYFLSLRLRAFAVIVSSSFAVIIFKVYKPYLKALLWRFLNRLSGLSVPE